jgi:hypothetical protein
MGTGMMTRCRNKMNWKRTWEGGKEGNKGMRGIET